MAAAGSLWQKCVPAFALDLMERQNFGLSQSLSKSSASDAKESGQ